MGADAEQGEVAVDRHDGQGQLFPWKVRQLREKVGDERGLGARRRRRRAEEGAPSQEVKPHAPMGATLPSGKDLSLFLRRTTVSSRTQLGKPAAADMATLETDQYR